MAANASGNDKAPLLILALLAGLAVLCLASALALVIGGGSRAGRLKPLCLGSFLPLSYAAMVLTLSHLGVVDSLIWLGLR